MILQLNVRCNLKIEKRNTIFTTLLFTKFSLHYYTVGLASLFHWPHIHTCTVKELRGPNYTESFSPSWNFSELHKNISPCNHHSSFKISSPGQNKCCKVYYASIKPCIYHNFYSKIARVTKLFFRVESQTKISWWINWVIT